MKMTFWRAISRLSPGNPTGNSERLRRAGRPSSSHPRSQPWSGKHGLMLDKHLFININSCAPTVPMLSVEGACGFNRNLATRKSNCWPQFWEAIRACTLDPKTAPAPCRIASPSSSVGNLHWRERVLWRIPAHQRRRLTRERFRHAPRGSLAMAPIKPSAPLPRDLEI